jgi:hypothetical protein
MTRRCIDASSTRHRRVITARRDADDAAGTPKKEKNKKPAKPMTGQ